MCVPVAERRCVTMVVEGPSSLAKGLEVLWEHTHTHSRGGVTGQRSRAVVPSRARQKTLSKKAEGRSSYRGRRSGSCQADSGHRSQNSAGRYGAGLADDLTMRTERQGPLYRAWLVVNAVLLAG